MTTFGVQSVWASGFHAILPAPPSINAYWDATKGRKVPSPAVKAYFETVRTLLGPLRRHGYPTLQPVSYRFVWYRQRASGDLSNRIKLLEDALETVVYPNDRSIVGLAGERRDTDKEHPRLELWVDLGPRPGDQSVATDLPGGRPSGGSSSLPHGK